MPVPWPQGSGPTILPVGFLSALGGGGALGYTGAMGFKTYTCPIARECGGCEWLAVPYPIQLRRKGEYVEQLFSQMAEADGATIEPVRGMDEPLAYRHKAATPFAPGKGGSLRSGFYAAGTHRIVACESCLVEDPRARRILGEVARIARELRIPAYAEDRGTGVLRHAVVRCGWKTSDVMLVLVTNGPRLPHAEKLVEGLRTACPELTTIVQNINDRRTNAILGRECLTLYGPGKMSDQLLGCTFEIGPTSFYQTNPAQTEVLYGLAIEGSLAGWSGGTDGLRLLDAYCGTGTIGICAASRSNELQVVGVEQVGGAVKCAKRNARTNGLESRCRYLRADATEYLTTGALRRRSHGPAARGLHARVPLCRGGAWPPATGLRLVQRRDPGPRPGLHSSARVSAGEGLAG